MNTTDWHIADKWEALGFSTNKPGLFEGFHEPHVLVLLDEAKSIPGEIYDAVNRIFSGRTVMPRMLQLSTPGLPNGRHYDAFHSKKAQNACIAVNPFEASYTYGGTTWRLPPTKHITPEFIEEMKQEYGEDNPVYRSMILGLWTKEDEYCLFGVDSLTLMRRELEEEQKTSTPEHYMGCDVARSLEGDESVFYHVIDWKVPGGDTVHEIAEFEAFHTRDAKVYRQRLKRTAQAWGVPPENIYIDGVGIGGPVCDELQGEGWMVNEVVSGASAEVENPKLANIRSQMWWLPAEKARKGFIYGLKDERTAAQLSEPRFKYNKKDEILVEPKDETRTRMVRERAAAPWKSPDRGDGVLLALIRTRNDYIPAYKIQGA